MRLQIPRTNPEPWVVTSSRPSHLQLPAVVFTHPFFHFPAQWTAKWRHILPLRRRNPLRSSPRSLGRWRSSIIRSEWCWSLVSTEQVNISLYSCCLQYSNIPLVSSSGFSCFFHHWYIFSHHASVFSWVWVPSQNSEKKFRIWDTFVSRRLDAGYSKCIGRVLPVNQQDRTQQWIQVRWHRFESETSTNWFTTGGWVEVTQQPGGKDEYFRKL